MKLVDLLENYIILKERDRETYYDIKDNIDKYKDFIRETLLNLKKYHQFHKISWE